jgi:tyrosinase
MLVLATSAGPMGLTDGPVRVPLSFTVKAGTADNVLANRLATLGPERRLYLVLRDFWATAQPGVLYQLYLDLPPDVEPRRGDRHAVGLLNFYNGVPLADAAVPLARQSSSRSFDITELVRDLEAQGLLSMETTVTIVPIGVPSPEAKPFISRIELVEQ